MNITNQQMEIYVIKGMMCDMNLHLNKAMMLQTKILEKLNNLTDDTTSQIVQTTDNNNIQYLENNLRKKNKNNFYSKQKKPNVPSYSKAKEPNLPYLKAKEPNLSYSEAKEETSISVKSFTNDDVYVIDKNDGTCSCPHYTYHGPLICKHLNYVIKNPSKFDLNDEELNNVLKNNVKK